jgi:hypothetical protein
LYSNEAEFIPKLLNEKKKISYCGLQFDWLIIFCFTSHSRIFHFHVYGNVTINGERLQNLGLCSAIRAFEQEGIFIVPHVFIRRTAPFSRFLRQTRGCEGQILTQILTGSFYSKFRYIDFVLTFNNNQFHSYVDLIYPNELEIKDTTECSTSASYLDMHALLNWNYWTLTAK